MNDQQILTQLTRWHEAMQACEAQMDALSALTGYVPESPLPDAIYRVMCAYTETVADMIGWDEQALSAWWLDRNFGEKPMKIGFKGEPLRSIASIEALAEFIAEDLQRAAA